MRRSAGLWLACALAATPALAQEPAPPVLLKDATVLVVDGAALPRASVLVRDGKIAAVGPDVAAPAGARVIDCKGRFVMPGIIDVHSHMGVYSWPAVPANSDGNEATAPVTAEVRAEDSVNAEDPAFAKARAGGVTTVQVLPGSANLIGGEAVILKLRPTGTLEGLRFAGAPRGLKMALGENPKRVYGGRSQSPSTRMGNAAVLRAAYQKAREYTAKWERHAAQKAAFDRKVAAGEKHPADAPPPPDRDLQLETLAAVLRGEVRLHVHCYEVHDLEFLFRLVDEFGLKHITVHHALETYKVADELARRGMGATTWVDWWGFKVEAWDGIPYALPILFRKGVLASIHSDSSREVQWLYHNAAKAVRYGLAEADALRAITLNPATQLGVADRVGSVTVGKDADLAVFSKHPFDMYTRVDLTLIDGAVAYERGR